jgi:hypothetical protein
MISNRNIRLAMFAAAAAFCLAGQFPADAARITGLELAGGYGGAPPPAPETQMPPPESAPPASSDGAGTPLHDCKLGCANQCKTFSDEGLAAQCRGSCEAKCESKYGK